MNCHEADNLIDLRVQELAEPGSVPAQDWSRLDEHLASCPKCKATFQELLGTHELVAALSEETPTDEERAHMLAAIQADLNEEPLEVSSNIIRNIARFTAAAVGIAAVLGLAFMLGEYQYHGTGLLGGGVFSCVESSVFSNVDGSIGPAEADGFADADADGQADRDDAYNQIVGGGGFSLDVPAGAALRERGRFRVQAGRDVAGKAIQYGFDVPTGPAEAERFAGQEVPERVRRTFSSRLRSPFTLSGERPISDEAGFKDADSESGGFAIRGTAVLGQEPITVGTQLKQIKPTSGSPNARGLKPTALSAGGFVAVIKELKDGQEEPPPTAGSVGDDRGEPPADRSSSSPPPPQTSPRPQARIIKTGELSLEVETYEAAVEKVANIVGRFEGYVADASTQEQTGGALRGRVVIR
ncbi:MAG: DUF4349 domain-containing protein, partial [Acidobacteriota bacterium]